MSRTAPTKSRPGWIPPIRPGLLLDPAPAGDDVECADGVRTHPQGGATWPDARWSPRPGTWTAEEQLPVLDVVELPRRHGLTVLLFVDRYPPFTLGPASDHPARIEAVPTTLDRSAVLFHPILMIPAAVVRSLAASGRWAAEGDGGR
ncbi:hypothetical protein [Streptomyces sp. ML-6]|uniref:hypothetical protein n=1 Tax=Streptomyces sp. ML-6 TaxID=2982693 RepID=UPI0024BFBF61|nr:hypothetical protein [Streptomyces sp. ML-6]MDK0517794.1 hypothetical protein [Streptomyces sp. ML-6]